jgi:catechol 2,3-dioxygenase-like lactoylglutathione lyase family enzyme
MTSNLIAHVALLVRDYDEAIAWFTTALGFRLLHDEALSATKRWVLVGPAGGTGTSLLLARAATPEQVAAVGRQGGGRVFLFLHTDDFRRDYEGFRSRGVPFVEGPREEEYGTVAVFEDLYGNRWDLVQPRHTGRGAS